MKQLLYIYLILFSLPGLADDFGNSIEKCLRNPEITTEACVDQHVTALTLSSCFKVVDKIKSPLSKENLQQFCFYNVSEFPTIKACLRQAERMNVAVHHDDAIFECVRQFQTQLTKKQCQDIAIQMRYPEKRNHLKRNCNLL
jgi:hypothetical protein